MAQIARLAGALLAHTDGRYYLIGDTTADCDFADVGFQAPSAPIDARKRLYIELKAVAPVPLEPTVISVSVEGSALVQLLVERMLDAGGAVSDELWSLIVGESEDTPDVPGELEAEWFVQMPKRVWDVVREGVLGGA
jgi:hypothetical protein